MTPGSFRFGPFTLRPEDRQLLCDDRPVDLNGRYLDALALLVRERGTLVSKARFMDEVWRGVPVTDEALTQCVKTLRRRLGDDAAAPRFIETVPKHGYRFVAPVEVISEERRDVTESRLRERFIIGIAGTIGGAVAGTVGGLFYGFAAASAQGPGAASTLLVVLCITTFVALLGAAGVSFGIAPMDIARHRPPQWVIAGGALGGLVVGAVVKLLGLDAFDLLFGHSPGDITGPFEGVLLGGAVGLGAWLATRASDRGSMRRGIAAAAGCGSIAGGLVPLIGGRLMGGSLDLLAQAFPTSRLSLAPVGATFGETGFGSLTQLVTGALEGGLFAGCIVGAMLIARRRLAARRPPARTVSPAAGAHAG